LPDEAPGGRDRARRLDPSGGRVIPPGSAAVLLREFAMGFKAPTQDMLFTLEHVAGLPAIAALPGFEDAGIDTARAVLEECARLNEEVIAVLNREGDLSPSTLADGVVTTTPGFKEAFRQFCDGGWQGIQHPVEFRSE